ncbi:hypothetical protein [Chiayiivirga flava]|uniref:Uncharacterized protein n=1 Tax=Chiayiivirga flava TaxID=659595 RepID=A0A7W8G2F2_9GAMM|nr:hypothetical protein [Chiayiivirga flava]MBB5208655.1 hypothetical protein [Chiayiivirga flava]
MLTELALVSPFIVAQRMQQAALPGTRPTAAQRRELQRMVEEKSLAFGAGGIAVGLRLFDSWQRAWWQAWTQPLSPAAWPSMLALLDDGLRPAHRTAMANARRLARTRSRPTKK